MFSSTPLLLFVLISVKIQFKKGGVILNRIKKARQLRSIPQNKLAEKLGITQQAISRYENDTRTPDEETLKEISHILMVPVEYLTRETNDPDGWELWEKASGYTIQEIQNEIDRIKKAEHVIGDPNDLQNLIRQAVANLGGIGNTDKGIIDKIASSIIKLQRDLDKKYLDPKKISKKTLSENKEITILPASTKIEDIIFRDLNPKAYELASDILLKARRDLQNISNKLNL